MKMNNKGFSLIEMVIVIAVMAILAALSMVTFNMANSRRPEKVKNSFTYCADYSKNLVKAQDKNCCMLIMKDTDGEYYAVQGQGGGVTQLQLALGDDTEVFKSKKADGTELSLDEVLADPTAAADYKNLGRFVQIWYTDNAGSDPKLVGEASGTGTPYMFVKFRKYDGAVILGDGLYEFSEYSRANETNRSKVTIKTSVVLEKSTGVCHVKNN